MPEPTQTNTTVADATQPNQPTQPDKGATPESFEAWLEGQDDTVKGLIGKRFESLENTVKATREERDNFSKQIKALAKQQADGSEAKRQLEEMGAQLEKSERRAAFLEDAMKPEIQCRNARAAWVLAESENLFDKKGAPDWNAIKAAAPELFGVPVANANAGAGTQKPVTKPNDMNAFIRSKAGRVS